MNRSTVDKYISKLKAAELSYPFGKQLAVYSLNDEMFAIIELDKQPIRLSLRCDKRLADLLIARYEEVMLAPKLHKDKWIRVVASGQLTESEIEGLIDHSYQIVSAETV